jgi:hypothetical protein
VRFKVGEEAKAAVKSVPIILRLSVRHNFLETMIIIE